MYGPSGCINPWSCGSATWCRRNEQHEGHSAPRGVAATGRGKPLKVEAQGRYRHETRLEGRGWNQGVKRLRKPEGAAQPGEVNPVQVAARALKRRRATKPHGRTARSIPGRFVGLEDREQAVSAQTLDARRRAREDGVTLRCRTGSRIEDREGRGSWFHWGPKATAGALNPYGR